MKPRSSKNSATRHQGFALVATIMMMVLIAILILGILSLSTVELRKSSMTEHQEAAKANARMAAMIALGELQSKLGPDQRVTATASILDESVDEHKRNWTSVWNTSAWNPRDPIGTRENAYMGALVSGGGYSESTNEKSALSALAQPVDASDPNWVPLVGSGSVSDDGDYVYVPRVNILDSSQQTTGRYAYWIGDEGVKARVDIPESEDAPSNTWATIGKLASAPGTGAHKMDGLSSYKSYLPDGPNSGDLARFVSIKTLDLGDLNSAAIKDHFHHLTASHTGLLVDNRLGGIRRDLSMAFEIDPAEFSMIDEFNNSGETNQTEEYTSFVPSDVTTNPLYYHNGTDAELGYLYEVPVDATNRYRGPTWDLLRNHYRVYKKERNSLNFRGLPTPGDGALAAHGVVPMSYTGNPNNLTGASLGAVYVGPNYSGSVSYQIPIVSPHGMAGGYSARDGNMVQPTVQKITPELIRSVIVYGLSRIGNEYLFTATPYFTFHNPYNYPLEFYSLSVDARGLGAYLDFFVSYTDINGSKVTDQRVEFQQSDYFTLKTLLSFRLPPPTGDTYRLEPGEIRMMSMMPNTEAVEANENAIRFTEFKYNEENGVVKDLDFGNIDKSENQFDVKPDTQMSLKVRTKNPATLGSMIVRMYHPEKATGGAYDLADLNNFANDNQITNRYNDTEPVTLIKNMKIMPKPRLYDSPEEIRTFNENQLTTPDEGFLALFVMDMRMKTFQDDVAVLSDFNYRSLGLCTRDYDAGDDLAPNWIFEINPIGDYSELQLTDDVNATGYWGTSHEAGSGQSKLILFDLPRSPSVSLATLQHADTSKLNFHPMRSIAHSRAQVGQADLTKIHSRLNKIRGNTIPKRQIDTAWASNEALWDRYFYSGINWGDQPGQPYATQEEAVQAIIDGDADKVFANSRIQLVEPVSQNNLAELTGTEGYARLGDFLGIRGAFNVNSTSVEVWKAILAGLSGHEISYLSGAGIVQKNLGSDLSPISRFSTPAGDENNDPMGFRALSDAELTSLAEAIVDQVKLRGPFIGLSDFVNRRLQADETGKAGAIQAAIDASGINSSVAMGTTSHPRLKQSAQDANEGMARHISQGDVLNSLAPIMATRSDTFTIRAYGESVDAGGEVKATALCELVVQRTPEWMEHTSEEATRQNPDYPTQNFTTEPILKKWEENPDLPELCKRFGRKFRVQSFRWLSENEI